MLCLESFSFFASERESSLFWIFHFCSYAGPSSAFRRWDARWVSDQQTEFLLQVLLVIMSRFCDQTWIRAACTRYLSSLHLFSMGWTPFLDFVWILQDLDSACLQPFGFQTECSAHESLDQLGTMEADTGGAADAAPSKKTRHPTIDAPASDEEAENFMRRGRFLSKHAQTRLFLRDSSSFFIYRFAMICMICF